MFAIFAPIIPLSICSMKIKGVGQVAFLLQVRELISAIYLAIILFVPAWPNYWGTEIAIRFGVLVLAVYSAQMAIRFVKKYVLFVFPQFKTLDHIRWFRLLLLRLKRGTRSKTRDYKDVYALLRHLNPDDDAEYNKTFEFINGLEGYFRQLSFIATFVVLVFSIVAFYSFVFFFFRKSLLQTLPNPGITYFDCLFYSASAITLGGGSLYPNSLVTKTAVISEYVISFSVLVAFFPLFFSLAAVQIHIPASIKRTIEVLKKRFGREGFWVLLGISGWLFIAIKYFFKEDVRTNEGNK